MGTGMSMFLFLWTQVALLYIPLSKKTKRTPHYEFERALLILEMRNLKM